MWTPVVLVLQPIRAGQEESYRARLSLSQLDVSVDGLELEAWAPRFPDMGPQVLGVETAADCHLEVREQRSVHRFQIDVAAEVAGEVDDHTAVHRLELHVGVRID